MHRKHIALRYKAAVGALTQLSQLATAEDSVNAEELLRQARAVIESVVLEFETWGASHAEAALQRPELLQTAQMYRSLVKHFSLHELIRFRRDWSTLIWRPLHGASEQQPTEYFQKILSDVLNIVYFVELKKQAGHADGAFERLCFKLLWGNSLTPRRQSSFRRAMDPVDKGYTCFHDDALQVIAPKLRDLIQGHLNVFPEHYGHLSIHPLAMDRMSFLMALRAYGFPAFDSTKPARPASELIPGDAVLVLIPPPYYDDCLTQAEALYETGAVPLLLVSGETDASEYGAGAEWVIKVSRAIIRTAAGYEKVFFENPVIPHVTSYRNDIVPINGDYFQETVCDHKDIAQGIIQKAGVPEPDSIVLRHSDIRSPLHRWFNATFPIREISPRHAADVESVLRNLLPDYDDIVIKPGATDGGVGIRMGRLSDPLFFKAALEFIDCCRVNHIDLIIQKRINPPPFEIDGVEQDVNFRVFITLDSEGRPMVIDAVARFGPRGGPINISLTAKPMTFAQLCLHWKLSDESKQAMWANLCETALATYQAVELAAQKAKAELNSTTPYRALIWTGIDLIPRLEADGLWKHYLIEYNGDNAGAQWDLGQASGDRTLAAREWARRVIDLGRETQACMPAIAARPWKDWDNDLAIAHYERLIREEPGLARHHAELAALYSRKFDLVRAAETYRASTDLQPYNYALWNDRLRFSRLAQPERQLALLDELINAEPRFLRARYDRASLRMHQGRYAEAQNDLQVLVDHMYNIGEIAQEWLRHAAMRLDKDAIGSVTRYLRQAVAERWVDADHAGDILSAIYGVANAKFIHASVELLEIIKTVTGDTPRYHLVSAHIACEAGQTHVAIEMLTLAMQLHPQAKELGKTLANIYWYSGDFENTETCLKALHANDLPNTTLLEDIVKFYLQQGRPAAAWEAVAATEAALPESPEEWVADSLKK